MGDGLARANIGRKGWSVRSLANGQCEGQLVCCVVSIKRGQGLLRIGCRFEPSAVAMEAAHLKNKRVVFEKICYFLICWDLKFSRPNVVLKLNVQGVSWRLFFWDVNDKLLPRWGYYILIYSQPSFARNITRISHFVVWWITSIKKGIYMRITILIMPRGQKPGFAR